MSRVGRLVAIAATGALVGCGSSAPDPGAQARAALSRLNGTALPQRVLAISDRAGQAPSTCKVFPDPATADGYRVVVAWGQLAEDYVTLPRDIVLANVGRTASFHVVEVPARAAIPAQVQADVRRASLSTAALSCQALVDGRLQLR